MRSRPVLVHGTEFILRKPPWAPQVPVAQWCWKPFDPENASLKANLLPVCREAVRTNYRPSRGRQTVVLVFSVGLLNEGLLRWLRYYGLKYFMIDYEDFTWRGTLRMGLTGVNELTLGPARLQLSDLAAVIWNPPPPGELVICGPTPERSLHRYLRAERWIQSLKDLPAFLPPSTLWLPSPPLGGSWEWQHKLSEYVYARAAGLRVPDTLTSNDPSQVRGFLRKWKGRVLFKELSHALVRFRTAFANGFDARRLRTAPISLQQYIEKEYDVRAVVVGDSVFACRIDSQASEMAKVDWRVWDSAHVRWDRMRLPRSVERAILRLMRRLHLLWGSVDLAKSTDGGFYFFEVNRPGSQYWLLPYVGLDVTKEIAAYLDRVLRR